MTPRRFITVTLLTAAALTLGLAVLAGAATPQQPRHEAPPPATCEQAMGENRQYRDRIASQERQIDATNEEAKTYYIRADVMQEAYVAAIRLADHYRLEAAALRSERDRLRDELRRPPRARRPSRR